MKKKFVDTNIFIRFITKDDVIKAKKCYELFKKAKNKKIILITSESVLSEVIYILSSKVLYNLSRKRIRELLEPIIDIKNLRIDFRNVFLVALRIYGKENIDFEDALTVAYMKDKNLKEIYSYDRDFDKFSEIKRIEP